MSKESAPHCRTLTTRALYVRAGAPGTRAAFARHAMTLRPYLPTICRTHSSPRARRLAGADQGAAHASVFVFA
jgi:hypothetical protein